MGAFYESKLAIEIGEKYKKAKWSLFLLKVLSVLAYSKIDY